jgi:hypothetical protein
MFRLDHFLSRNPPLLHSPTELINRIIQFQTFEPSTFICHRLSPSWSLSDISHLTLTNKCARETLLSNLINQNQQHVVNGHRQEMSLFSTPSRNPKGDILAALLRPSLPRNFTEQTDFLINALTARRSKLEMGLPSTKAPPFHPEILRVCHACLQEASPILCSKVILFRCVRDDTSSSSCVPSALRLGSRNLSHIQALTVGVWSNEFQAGLARCLPARGADAAAPPGVHPGDRSRTISMEPARNLHAAALVSRSGGST